MIDNLHTAKYWQEEDFQALRSAENFKDLYTIAHRIFARMPDGIIQVCGPIATGGLGSVEANLLAFDKAIRKLQDEGMIVFDQMPFEWPMQELKKKIPDAAATLLDDFYLPLFTSGKIKKVYFIPGWETSFGANWEHDQAERLGIPIEYLT